MVIGEQISLTSRIHTALGLSFHSYHFHTVLTGNPWRLSESIPAEGNSYTWIPRLPFQRVPHTVHSTGTKVTIPYLLGPADILENPLAGYKKIISNLLVLLYMWGGYGGEKMHTKSKSKAWRLLPVEEILPKFPCYLSPPCTQGPHPSSCCWRSHHSNPRERKQMQPNRWNFRVWQRCLSVYCVCVKHTQKKVAKYLQAWSDCVVMKVRRAPWKTVKDAVLCLFT